MAGEPTAIRIRDAAGSILVVGDTRRLDQTVDTGVCTGAPVRWPLWWSRTIPESLVQKLDDAVVYVTATSRKPRPGEADGVRYYFYSPEKFRQEIEAGNFFEWSIVHAEFKGVRRDILGDTLRSHKIVIVKPDPQGMRKIKSQLPEVLTIFIMPPSIEALQRRLEHRGTETPEQRAARLRNAEIEMAAAPEYDHVVVNEDGKLDGTVDEIANIIRTESRQPRHYDL